MKLAVSLVVVAGLALAGCVGGQEPDGPEAPVPVETYTARVAPDWTPEPEEPEPEDPSADPTWRRRATPDPDLVAALDCEIIPSGFFETEMTDFGVPTKAIRVSAGPGLDPEVEWSIAIFDMPWDDMFGPRVDVYLTNAFSSHDADSPERWQWIRVAAGDPWHFLEWDDDALVWGESALTKAHDCLASVES